MNYLLLTDALGNMLVCGTYTSANFGPLPPTHSPSARGLGEPLTRSQKIIFRGRAP